MSSLIYTTIYQSMDVPSVLSVYGHTFDVMPESLMLVKVVVVAVVVMVAAPAAGMAEAAVVVS